MSQIFSALIVLVFISSGVHAALLTNIQGQVSVNTGDGFKRVTAPTQVNPGDRVMVGANGQAQVLYDASCFNSVGASQVIIVPQGVPCNTQTPAEQAAATGGVGTTTLIVGGLVVAAGAGVAIALSNKKPASP